MHVCKCPGENHPTYGACLRSKNLSFPGVFSTRSQGAGSGDRSVQKRWDREIDSYKDARRQGIQPAGTQQWQIDAAVKQSERVGMAFDAGSPAEEFFVK